MLRVEIKWQLTTDHQSLVTNYRNQGLGAGVGRGLGEGAGRGVIVGLTVPEGVAVGVGVGVAATHNPLIVRV